MNLKFKLPVEESKKLIRNAQRDEDVFPNTRKYLNERIDPDVPETNLEYMMVMSGNVQGSLKEAIEAAQTGDGGLALYNAYDAIDGAERILDMLKEAFPNTKPVNPYEESEV